jgi:opacity protein-like surface antigen
MRRSKLFIAALAAVTMFVSGAHAADMDQMIPTIQEDAYVPVEVGSGWYLRGDIGYNLSARHKTESYTLGVVDYDSNYRDALTYGAGFGYRFNEMIRFDAGLERLMSSSFSSRRLVAPTGPCHGTGSLIDLATGTTYLGPYDINNCIEQDKASYSAIVAMGNAYVDLGTYRGITPFLGAGLGLARISYTEEIGSITCVPVASDVHFEACSAVGTIAQPAPNTTYTEPGVVNSGKDWRVAYALSAGFAYDLSRNLKLDTTYKFSSIAGGKGGIPYGSTPGSNMSKDGFSLHQIKMGLRYEIW